MSILCCKEMLVSSLNLGSLVHFIVIILTPIAIVLKGEAFCPQNALAMSALNQYIFHKYSIDDCNEPLAVITKKKGTSTCDAAIQYLVPKLTEQHWNGV